MKNSINRKQKIFGYEVPEIIYISVQFVAIFLITFVLLYAFGLVPDEFKTVNNTNFSDSEKTITNNSVGTTDEDELKSDSIQTQTRPSRITIPKIGVDAVINHPNSYNIQVLDEALKTGAVYYPGSGTIEEGNMFVFGHSTNWKVVNNPAYKTFNNLDKLSKGDEITILDENGETHIYAVDKVTLADDSAALVNFDHTGRKLTISTCNTFGQKQERWVVEATFKK